MKSMRDNLVSQLNLQYLDPTLFDWSTWRLGSEGLIELSLVCDYKILTTPQGINELRKHAVGWCKGETLLCRPKVNHIALMCHKNDNHFWFHLRNEEFKEVFK